MDLGLNDARALVCGASRGLGLAVAEALAGEGARVALASRGAEALTEQAERLGGVAVPVDLSTAEGPAEAVAAAVDALGGLDLLVANTGGPPPGDFAQLDEEAWQRAIDGTLHAPLRLLRAAIPHLQKSDRASILMILSSSVRGPLLNLTTSNVLRPGLAGLLKSLTLELAPAIRINGIAPGRIATSRLLELDTFRAEQSGSTPEAVRDSIEGGIPLGRYGEPPELGRVGAFLLSPAASYVTGQIVLVDGGLTPSLP